MYLLNLILNHNIIVFLIKWKSFFWFCMRRATSRRSSAEDRLSKYHNACTSSQRTPATSGWNINFQRTAKSLFLQNSWGITEHTENLLCQNTSLFAWCDEEHFQLSLCSSGGANKAKACLSISIRVQSITWQSSVVVLYFNKSNDIFVFYDKKSFCWALEITKGTF